jgi:hypothetical protein
MIFGFNTDIKVDETVYHVQSEAREAEKLLQTQVFVKGHCIGKRALSYSIEEAAGQNEQTRHELLRDQHRSIVQAIREGQLDSVIEAASVKLAANVSAAAAPLAAEAAPVLAPPTPPPLELKFLGSSRPSEDSFLIRFGVTRSDAAVEGAVILAQFVPDSASETFSGGAAKQGVTDQDGLIELALPVPSQAQSDTKLVVQVHYSGISFAKKFRIKTQS